MAQHGDSGRIVVSVEPELKRRLYATLSLSGSTLKDWFWKTAEEYCAAKTQPSGPLNVRYGHSEASKAVVLREDSPHSIARAVPTVIGKAGKKHSVISMFSGCGGMDLGFSGGFEVL